jgi:hypothetical protein
MKPKRIKKKKKRGCPGCGVCPFGRSKDNRGSLLNARKQDPRFLKENQPRKKKKSQQDKHEILAN